MERFGAWAQTYTGKKFWPLDPKPEDVDLQDIAQGLANQCRFNGHCKEFYSVAQHSVIVSKIVNPDQSLAALFHDASESYTGDIVSPLKRYLPKDFKEIEFKIEQVIFEKFKIMNVDEKEIKKADIIALVTEKRDVMGPAPEEWGMAKNYKPLKEKIIPLGPNEAKKLFLDRFKELTQQ